MVRKKTEEEKGLNLSRDGSKRNTMVSRNSRVVTANMLQGTSKRGSRLKAHRSHGEDEDLEHSITTISHIDDLYSDTYWKR